MIRQHPAPQPGTLLFSRGVPNLHGAKDAAVYLFGGDAATEPVTRIVPADGVQFPSGLLPLAHPVRIKLLHFNDLHGRISGLSAEGPTPIFSRMVSWLAATRARYADDPQVAVLAASGGDESGGAIFDALLGSGPETYQLHAGYRLYSQAGIDVGVLGNHDFDRGAALLAHAIRQDVRFPLLAANVSGDLGLSRYCYPAALFVTKGVRVGFIGLITPAEIHPEPDGRCCVTDPLEAAHNLIPAIRPLCDVLIVLSHLGYSLNQRSAAVRIAGDVELARSLLPGAVDLIVGGHTHSVLNEGGLSAENIVNGIPIVQAGKFGQFVGEIDITVDKAVAVTHATLTATTDLPVDAAFEREHVQPLLEQVRPYRERVIGRVAQDEDLGTDAVRNAFASGENALANFIADAIVSQARVAGYPVDFAMIDASSVAGGLPIGHELTFGDWFEVMPFADTLRLFRLSGRQIFELLQDNALRVDRPNVPHTERGFLHFSEQIRYTIGLGPTPGQAAAVDITVNGQPIEDQPERIFLIACGSFVRGPAAPWEASAQGISRRLFDLQQALQECTQLCVRDLLVDFITAYGGVLAEAGARRDGRLRVLPPTTG